MRLFAGFILRTSYLRMPVKENHTGPTSRGKPRFLSYCLTILSYGFGLNLWGLQGDNQSLTIWRISLILLMESERNTLIVKSSPAIFRPHFNPMIAGHSEDLWRQLQSFPLFIKKPVPCC